MSLDDEAQAELALLDTVDRLRVTRPLAGASRARPSDGELGPLISFCSNDYLGLATHPLVRGAAVHAIEHSGFGAGASRLVSGETPAHRSLERELAAFLGYEDALLFPTGYQANLGVLTTLASREDLIVSDASNHASIIDGCRLSRATVVIYPHLDAAAALAGLRTDGPFRRRILVTESVFSMDGDRAPLAHLAEAAKTTGSVFIVDDAHAFGVCGARGSGLAADPAAAPDVLIGTLGKALGSLGGFAACSVPLRHLFVNRARSFIYTTAPPPAVAAAASAALAIIQSQEGEVLRAQAAARATQLRIGMAALGLEGLGQDLIIPVVLGADSRALRAAALLAQERILVTPIRPPTVPSGRSRLRITVSAAHTRTDVDFLLAVIATKPGLFRSES